MANTDQDISVAGSTVSTPSGGAGGTLGSSNVTFALTPARVSSSIIDYSSSEGMKLYNKSTAALSIIFDGDSINLKTWLEKLWEHSTEFNWDTIVTIPDNDGTKRNLITNFGQLSKANVKAHAVHYVNSKTRDAQNSMQMAICITASLSIRALNKVINDAHHYRFNGVTSGPLLLKYLIDATYVDTVATCHLICSKLGDLDDYMVSINSNVEKFNTHVKVLIAGLAARGEESNDITINLFKGYKAASDQVFVKYIKDKETIMHEGSKISDQLLMNLALNKYLLLIEDNTWNTKTEDQEKVIALSAQLDLLKQSNKSFLKKLGASRKTPKKKIPPIAAPAAAPRGGRQGQEKYAWKLIPPTDGSTTKVMNGKTYYWCDGHEAWTLHKPSECRKMIPAGPGDEMEIDPALAAMILEEEEQDSDGDSNV
jgi:hypothetical protein